MLFFLLGLVWTTVIPSLALTNFVCFTYIFCIHLLFLNTTYIVYLVKKTRNKSFTQKHLRLRGENRTREQRKNRLRETPPLARRKQARPRRFLLYIRNTSACAEKTGQGNNAKTVYGKHLRLRGENFTATVTVEPVSETPPLARRKLGRRWTVGHPVGNTSACAEKTATINILHLRIQKHLRLRGEN